MLARIRFNQARDDWRRSAASLLPLPHTHASVRSSTSATERPPEPFDREPPVGDVRTTGTLGFTPSERGQIPAAFTSADQRSDQSVIEVSPIATEGDRLPGDALQHDQHQDSHADPEPTEDYRAAPMEQEHFPWSRLLAPERAPAIASGSVSSANHPRTPSHPEQRSLPSPDFNSGPSVEDICRTQDGSGTKWPRSENPRGSDAPSRSNTVHPKLR